MHKNKLKTNISRHKKVEFPFACQHQNKMIVYEIKGKLLQVNYYLKL